MSGTEISIDAYKKFLAEKMNANPRIIGGICSDADCTLTFDESLIASVTSQVESNWELEDEINMAIDTDHDYYDDTYYMYETDASVLSSDLVHVKIFTLSRDVLGDAVKFMVYEDTNKQLHLGEYVGL